MNLGQSELLSTLTNADESQDKPKSSELLQREEVTGTPFTIVGNEEKGYFLAMGKWKLSGHLPSKTAVIAYLDAEHWTITMNCIIVVTEMLEELRKSEN